MTYSKVLGIRTWPSGGEGVRKHYIASVFRLRAVAFLSGLRLFSRCDEDLCIPVRDHAHYKAPSLGCGDGADNI